MSTAYLEDSLFARPAGMGSKRDRPMPRKIRLSPRSKVPSEPSKTRRGTSWRECSSSKSVSANWSPGPVNILSDVDGEPSTSHPAASRSSQDTAWQPVALMASLAQGRPQKMSSTSRPDALPPPAATLPGQHRTPSGQIREARPPSRRVAPGALSQDSLTRTLEANEPKLPPVKG